MDSNLDAKRRELFELHKLKIGTDAPLMRKPVAAVVVEKPARQRPEVVRNPKAKYVIFAVAGVLVLAEVIYLIRESGWLE